MLNTIRLKILAVAVALLAVFAVTTGLSTWLVKNVAGEVDAITVYHIPIGAHVASMDILTLELEVELRRALAQTPLDLPRLAALRKRHAEIAATLKNDLKQVHGKLADGSADRRNDLEDRIVLASLKGSFAFIEARLGPFLRSGDAVLAAIESGDSRRAAAAMAGFAQFEAVFGKELANVRQALERLTQSSITETKKREVDILRLNGILFGAATVVGLGFFLVLTHRLQRSLAGLRAGMREVETGRLDVAVAVTSRDEIGRLTEAFNSMAGRLREKEPVKDTFRKYPAIRRTSAPARRWASRRTRTTTPRRA